MSQQGCWIELFKWRCGMRKMVGFTLLFFSFVAEQISKTNEFYIKFFTLRQQNPPKPEDYSLSPAKYSPSAPNLISCPHNPYSFECRVLSTMHLEMCSLRTTTLLILLCNCYDQAHHLSFLLVLLLLLPLVDLLFLLLLLLSFLL